MKGIGKWLMILLFWPIILMYKAIRWGWSRNKIVTAIVTAFALLALMMSEPPPDSETSKTVSTIQPPVQDVQAITSGEDPSTNTADIKTPENQKVVLEFEQALFDLEKSGQPAFDEFITVLDGVGSMYSIYDAYTAADNAANAARKIYTEGPRIPIPEQLPKELKSKLQDVSQDYSTAYFVREKAYNTMKKFLDDQKPSLMAEYKENMQGSYSFVLSSTSKLLEAKTMSGIDLSTQ